MIWLLGISLFLNLVLLILIGVEVRHYWRELDTKFQNMKNLLQFPECQFKPYEFRCNAIDQPCRYSPGSEPERICALREADKKGEHTFIREAPQWDRPAPSDEK